MKMTHFRCFVIFVMTIGLVLTSCQNPSAKSGPSESPKGGVQASGLMYQKVNAGDGIELIEYLCSTTTAYEINLSMPGQNIYIDTDLPITMPMKIIGNPDSVATIYTHSNEIVPTYYCLDVKADLELLYCNIKAYDKIFLASGQELPPVVVRSEATLTLGRGAVLSLEDYPYSIAYTGGTVIVRDGGWLIDKSAKGGKIFDCGIGNLVIDKTGMANLDTIKTVGDKETNLFQIVEGSFEIWQTNEEIVYVINGLINLNNDWMLPKDQILHAKSGRLVVAGGKRLILTKDIAGVVLDTNIELSSTGVLDLSADVAEVLKKFKGSGYIAIEDARTGSIFKGSNAFIGSADNSLFKPLGNARVELGEAGITLVTGEAELVYDGAYDLDSKFIVAGGAKLIITPGVSLKASLDSKLEGTAPRGNSKSMIAVMPGAALIPYPDENRYYPEISGTELPVELEWNNAAGNWVALP